MLSPANALVPYTRASTSLARVITPSETIGDAEQAAAEQTKDKTAFSAGIATVRIADEMLAALLDLRRA